MMGMNINVWWNAANDESEMRDSKTHDGKKGDTRKRSDNNAAQCNTTLKKRMSFSCLFTNVTYKPTWCDGGCGLMRIRWRIDQPGL